MAGVLIGVDGRGRGVLYVMAERHRRAGRGNGRASQIRGRRLPGGVCVDGAAADRRRQPQSADDADGDEPVRPKPQAIAANEAQYAEMWAQDAAAMYGYAASSASATSLTPFTPPQQNTNPGGSTAQAAAASQAAGTSAGNVQSTVSSIQQALSAVPTALTSAAAPAQALTPLDVLDLIADLISIFLDLPADLAGIFVSVPLGTLGIVSLPFDIGGYGTGVHTDDIISGWNGEQSWPGTGPAPVKPFPAPLLNLRAGTLPPPTLSAGLGEGEHDRSFVRAADVGCRHPGGQAHLTRCRRCRQPGPAPPPRQQQKAALVRRSARWRWPAWPGGPWPAP